MTDSTTPEGVDATPDTVPEDRHGWIDPTGFDEVDTDADLDDSIHEEDHA